MKQILTILIIALFFMTACSNTKTISEVENDPEEQDQENKIVEFFKNDMKTFEMTAEDYKFMMDGKENPEIKVKLGDNVTIKLTSTQGTHNFQINKLAARSRTVMTGESTTLNFIAHTAGTFEYFCGASIHERRGQEGTFIVEE